MMSGIAGGIWTDPSATVEKPKLISMLSTFGRFDSNREAPVLWSQFRTASPYPSIPGIGLCQIQRAPTNRVVAPIPNEDDSIQLVCTGRIDNYQDLRHRLEGAGHQFRTPSTAEAIVHLYESEGDECLTLLSGCFAMALWDSQRRRLLLARDHLGKRSLYLQSEPQRLLFASSLRCLIAVDSQPPTVNPSGVDAYLTYGFVPDSSCLLVGCGRLSPGEYVVFENGEIVRKMARMPRLERVTLSEADVKPRAEIIRKRLRQAVSQVLDWRHSNSSRVFIEPHGLSGLVSSCVRQSGIEPQSSEVPQHINLADHLVRLASVCDEPVSNIDAIRRSLLIESMPPESILISAIGYEQLFLDHFVYRWMSWLEIADKLPLPSRRLAARWLGAGTRLTGEPRRWRAAWGRFCAASAVDGPRRFLRVIEQCDELTRARLYDEQFLKTLPDVDPASHVPWPAGNHADSILSAYCDLKLTVASAHLPLAERISALHETNIMHPYLDRQTTRLLVTATRRIRRGTHRQLSTSDSGRIAAQDTFRLKLRDDDRVRQLVNDTVLASDARCKSIVSAEALQWLARSNSPRQPTHNVIGLVLLESWLRSISDCAFARTDV